jgi:predicted DsbA family dithiol-disulfide isomerase
LERAIAEVKDQFEFKVKWLPFFLNPQLPQEGMDKMDMYRRKFGSRNMDSMVERMKQIGAQEGIRFSYGGKVANTLNSHRLIDFAEQFGKQDKVVSILFRNYFEEEKNLGSLDVLVEAAREAGIDDEKARKYLSGEEGKDLVVGQARRITEEMGVTGVPFFLFNDRYSVSGAQEPATLIAMFRKVAAKY